MTGALDLIRVLFNLNKTQWASVLTLVLVAHVYFDTLTSNGRDGGVIHIGVLYPPAVDIRGTAFQVSITFDRAMPDCGTGVMVTHSFIERGGGVTWAVTRRSETIVDGDAWTSRWLPLPIPLRQGGTYSYTVEGTCFGPNGEPEANFAARLAQAITFSPSPLDGGGSP